MNKPARLYKCDSHNVLKKQLTISGREIRVVFIVSILIVIIGMMMQPATNLL